MSIREECVMFCDFCLAVQVACACGIFFNEMNLAVRMHWNAIYGISARNAWRGAGTCNRL